MAYRTIEETTKQRVKAGLLAGEKVNALARRYGLSPASVSRLRAELPTELRERSCVEQQERIDDLLYTCLQQHLSALSSIAAFTSRPQYLHRQKAKDLARLYGALSETMLRLIEVCAHLGLIGETAREAQEAREE